MVDVLLYYIVVFTVSSTCNNVEVCVEFYTFNFWNYII